MKKVILSIVVIVVFTGYSLFQRTESEEVNVIVPQNSSPSPSATQNQNSQSSIVSPTSVFKDGVYTGDVKDAFYGDLQVRVNIQNGRIVDVNFLKYPNDRDTSIEINKQAMPILRSEAIKIQNSQVDIVSGATQTSEAYRQSLQSALDKARG